MKVKELKEYLERFDEDSPIKLYNVNYTDSRFDLNFSIRSLYRDRGDKNNTVIMEINHIGDSVR